MSLIFLKNLYSGNLLGYGLVGLLSAFGSTVAFLTCTRNGLSQNAAAAVAYAVGFIVAYLGHGRYSFKQKHSPQLLQRFVYTHFMLIAINQAATALCAWFLTDVQTASILFFVMPCFSYPLYRYYTYA